MSAPAWGCRCTGTSWTCLRSASAWLCWATRRERCPPHANRFENRIGGKMAFRMKYFAAVAVWLTALTSAPIAIGQEQTQENAVRFLNLFALQNQLPIGFTARFDRLDAMQRLQLAVP